MKKALAIVIVVLLLAAMAPVALADGTTVYVSVSVDGKLLVAAEPVTVGELTADAVIKAAHKAYYSGGESGYTAGIDATWNMFLITQCWGVAATPYVIVNDAPLGAGNNASYISADTCPVKDGDNVTLCISSDAAVPATPVSLTATVSGGKATVTATLWTLDFTTFTYKSSPYSGSTLIDPATGASLGTTDANGSATVAIPESGKIAVDGLGAIKISAAAAGSAESASSGAAATEPAAAGAETSGDSAATPAAGGETAAPAAGSAAPETAQGPGATAGTVPVSADSIFLTVSVDGELKLTAQPMLLPADATVNGVLKAAHEQFYPEGLDGYVADTNNQWAMFLITKCWGVASTPYVMVNGAVLGSTSYNYMSDVAPVKAGDNVVISLSSDANVAATAISLTADIADGNATVTATSWVLDFATFTYSSSPFAGATVIEPASGTVLGTTDANGQITVPAVGVVAIDGLAAIPVDGSCGATSATAAPAAPAAPAATTSDAAPAAPTGEDTTVYVTISMDGVLQIAAQPVTTNVLTVDGALKAAHEKYFSGGAAGYHGGSASFGYMIDTIWGVQTTPYVIIGGAPLGSQKGEYSAYVSVDQCPIKEGDNIVVVFSSTGATPTVVSLAYDEDGYIIASSWALDFTTFTYTTSTYVDADVIDAETGEVLGTTDAFGKIKLKKTPDCGVVAITGLTAIPVGEVKSFTAYDGVYVPPAHDYSIFGGKDGRLLLGIVIVGLAFAVPLSIVVAYAQNKELKSKGVKYAEVMIKSKKH